MYKRLKEDFFAAMLQFKISWHNIPYNTHFILLVIRQYLPDREIVFPWLNGVLLGLTIAPFILALFS